ncbi:unnamed protein product [Nezara viridula]|uniref:Uncharacterized protein n=1 Tax=Nezara viridula TaxID=85310 RepID=A0A9P0MWX2_NEZVI|nr:unnamed protein product [Nezara viridula]
MYFVGGVRLQGQPLRQRGLLLSARTASHQPLRQVRSRGRNQRNMLLSRTMRDARAADGMPGQQVLMQIRDETGPQQEEPNRMYRGQCTLGAREVRGPHHDRRPGRNGPHVHHHLCRTPPLQQSQVARQQNYLQHAQPTTDECISSEGHQGWER